MTNFLKDRQEESARLCTLEQNANNDEKGVSRLALSLILAPMQEHHSYPSSIVVCLTRTLQPQSEPGHRATLYSDPGNGDDNVHTLLLCTLPLVAVCSVLLVVPEGTDGAVHAAAAVLLWF